MYSLIISRRLGRTNNSSADNCFKNYSSNIILRNRRKARQKRTIELLNCKQRRYQSTNRSRQVIRLIIPSAFNKCVAIVCMPFPYKNQLQFRSKFLRLLPALLQSHFRQFNFNVYEFLTFASYVSAKFLLVSKRRCMDSHLHLGPLKSLWQTLAFTL